MAQRFIKFIQNSCDLWVSMTLINNEGIPGPQANQIEAPTVGDFRVARGGIVKIKQFH